METSWISKHVILLVLFFIFLFPQTAQTEIKAVPIIIEQFVVAEEKKSYNKAEVIDLIKHYAREFNIPADLPLRIALCESGYRWDARNGKSGAAGVFQYLASTWRNTAEGRMGHSAYTPEANISAALRHLKVHGPGAWKASRQCWKK